MASYPPNLISAQYHRTFVAEPHRQTLDPGLSAPTLSPNLIVEPRRRTLSPDPIAGLCRRTLDPEPQAPFCGAEARALNCGPHPAAPKPGSILRQRAAAALCGRRSVAAHLGCCSVRVTLCGLLCVRDPWTATAAPALRGRFHRTKLYFQTRAQAMTLFLTITHKIAHKMTLYKTLTATLTQNPCYIYP